MKRTDIRTILGLTQNDISRLLGVSRSTWAMYEIGQRDLPLHATELLAEILVYLQSAKQTEKPQAGASVTLVPSI